jgi:hypothetical protein
MRLLFLALLPLTLLAGCNGQVRDFIGERGSITEPQLLRFGLSAEQARCVSQRLATLLLPRQLRELVQRAAATREGFFAPPGLTPRDLMWVARTIDDREIVYYLERADQACGALLGSAPAQAQAAPGAPQHLEDGRIVTVLGPGQLPPPDGVAPSAGASGAIAAAAHVPVWLNLGAAASGQAIAIDSATVVRAGVRRSAWFRLTDPGATAPEPDSFLLDVDCTARTINAKARRRTDAAGAQTDYRDYPDNPLPVEGGTVMEIAWLSLCT